LEGYARTIVAGAVAPTEATWVALMVLYTACLRSDHYPHRFSKRLATRQPSTSNVKSRRPRHKVRTPGIPSL